MFGEGATQVADAPVTPEFSLNESMSETIYTMDEG
jgi:hypothetical protein